MPGGQTRHHCVICSSWNCIPVSKDETAPHKTFTTSLLRVPHLPEWQCTGLCVRAPPGPLDQTTKYVCHCSMYVLKKLQVAGLGPVSVALRMSCLRLGHGTWNLQVCQVCLPSCSPLVGPLRKPGLTPRVVLGNDLTAAGGKNWPVILPPQGRSFTPSSVHCHSKWGLLAPG